MRNSGLSLQGFLPPRAFAMGKVSKEGFNAEVPSGVPEAGLCAFCGAPGHAAHRQDSDSLFLFVTDPLAPGSPESALLPKILDAMKLPLGGVRLWVLNRPMKAMPAECREVLLQECLKSTPGVLVAFGPLAAREEMTGAGGWSVVVTEGLAEMARQPELKKAAWEDLKRALQLSLTRSKKEIL